jgi:hypothetical protein
MEAFVPLKRLYFSEVYGVATQKAVFFMVIAVRTSNPTNYPMFSPFSSLCSPSSNTNVTELFRPSSETNFDISTKRKERRRRSEAELEPKFQTVCSCILPERRY